MSPSCAKNYRNSYDYCCFKSNSTYDGSLIANSNGCGNCNYNKICKVGAPVLSGAFCAPPHTRTLT